MKVHLYSPSGTDRVAVVSLQPAVGGDGVTVLVARGKSRKSLGGPVATHAPNRDIAWALLASAVASLKAEGFLRSGMGPLLTALDGKDRRKRALAARRLGWMRETGSVEALLVVAPKATDDLPAIVDALGELGDPRAVAFCRTIAEKKLLSRRRAGVEALRKLGDTKGGGDAEARAAERLPAAVKAALLAVEAGQSAPETLLTAVLQVPIKDRGLAIDSLYELGRDASVAAALGAIEQGSIEAPHMWRYVKSVFKRSMVRHDHATFGRLAHAIEVAGRATRGTTATVKSGYDGESRATRIFGRATQSYVRRLAWRYLRMLALHRPNWYAHAAAEAIVHYTHADEVDPHGRYGAYSQAYLLHRVLWDGGGRYALTMRTLQFRLLPSKPAVGASDAREEAFPELWDAQPKAYLRLLGTAQLPVVHEMALRAVRRAHMHVVTEAAHRDIVALLSAPYPPTVELGLSELQRRFDPENPDWELVQTLVVDRRAEVRSLGLDWLLQTRASWATDPSRVLALLAAPTGEARDGVATLVIAELDRATDGVRRAMAVAITAALAQAEPEEGAHEQHGRIAQSLAVEIAATASLDALMIWLRRGSAAAQSMAALALAQKEGAAAALGHEQLQAMACHELVALRSAAHALLRTVLPALRLDPSPLYSLLDSEWDDTRRFAVDLVTTDIDTATLSPEALLGLCDSHRAEVQKLGRSLVERHFSRVDAQVLVKRLAEHTDRMMRSWAVELAVLHLKDGYVPLAGLEEFFRTVLLDVAPDRKAKRDVIALLADRGLCDERQAEVACRLLGELCRSKTKDDSERALVALARIKVRFPDVSSLVTLREASQ